MMDRLQVIFMFLLLKTTIEPGGAGLQEDHTRCPLCPEGYFVVKNCTPSPERRTGIRCETCTNCSAAGLDTLVKCSRFVDSVCGHRPTLTPAVPPPKTGSWIILTVILVSVVLVLVLVLLSVSLVSCQKRNHHNHKGLDFL